MYIFGDFLLFNYSTLGITLFLLSSNFALDTGKTLTGKTGEVTSPKYPQRYENNVDDIHYIKQDAGTTIQITVKKMDIEEHSTCIYDYLLVCRYDLQH